LTVSQNIPFFFSGLEVSTTGSENGQFCKSETLDNPKSVAVFKPAGRCFSPYRTNSSQVPGFCPPLILIEIMFAQGHRWYEVCLKKLTIYCNLTGQSTLTEDGGPLRGRFF
jgi:hypothetical protein